MNTGVVVTGVVVVALTELLGVPDSWRRTNPQWSSWTTGYECLVVACSNRGYSFSLFNLYLLEGEHKARLDLEGSLG